MTRTLYSTLAFTASAIALACAAQAAPIQQTLQAKNVSLIGLTSADVKLNIVPGAQGVQISVDGKEDALKRLTFTTEGDTAVARMTRDNWGDINLSSGYDLTMTVTVAPGAALAVDDLIGHLQGGDLNGPVDLDAAAGEIVLGNVTNADIESSGSMDITLGNISGTLDMEVSGSGSLKAGSAGNTQIEIYGSGEADIASVNGSFALEISGSGEVSIGSVNGAVEISTTGSGDVAVKGGRANSFSVDSSGSSDVSFAGTAVNPQISTSGSGSVCIDTVEGNLNSDGADITIGKGKCN
jgi:hypothetical protein